MTIFFILQKVNLQNSPEEISKIEVVNAESLIKHFTDLENVIIKLIIF